MKKSVYSLVLMDDVVAAVDRMAYAVGTSRSNLINQILAEHLSCETPEMRMKQIFEGIGRRMEPVGSFLVQEMPSDTMLLIRSPLAYKYKPTIRYGIELYRSTEPYLGELRVSLRTQSRPLIEAVCGFYELFVRLEQHYLGHRLPAGLYTVSVDGRFSRRLLPHGNGSEAVSEALSAYIRLFDRLLKIYFAHLGQADAARRVELAYRQALQENDPMI